MRGGPQFAMTDPAQLDGPQEGDRHHDGAGASVDKYSKTIQEAAGICPSSDSTTDKDAAG